MDEASKIDSTEMIEVIDWYDRPVLFLAQNDALETFLVMLIDEDFDEADNRIETWLNVEVSDTRLSELRAGSIDLHDAYVRAEHGYVLKTVSPKGLVYVVAVKDLTEDMLASPGCFLSEGNQYAAQSED